MTATLILHVMLMHLCFLLTILPLLLITLWLRELFHLFAFWFFFWHILSFPMEDAHSFPLHQLAVGRRVKTRGEN